MSKLVVHVSVTLDGVMQAPGRRDEDLRDNFQYGGWAAPYFDAVMGDAAAEGMAATPDLLFGRRTYEDFYSNWPTRAGNPFTEVLNNSQKYVASRTLKAPLRWQNSTLLTGDAAVTVSVLKAEARNDLVVLGSGELVQSLMRHELVDEYMLLIHPLVLGSGRRFFREGTPYAGLTLIDTKTSTSGVIIATYQPAAPA